MSRLRYPFTEISARCRLCGAVGLTASSEHALGGRLIEWRRAHAPVCPEWPRWAANKGLRLDDKGALLYPNEDGPYVPRVRPRSDSNCDANGDDDDLEDLEELLADVADGVAPPPVARAAARTEPLSADEPENTHAAAPARRSRKPRGLPLKEPEREPRIDLMRVPAEDLLQAELF